MILRNAVNTCSDRFFLDIRHATVKEDEFFKAQNLGRNFFMKIVKFCCSLECISYSGVKTWITTHGLRGTLVILLL